MCLAPTIITEALQNIQKVGCLYLWSPALVMWEEHGLNVGHFTSIWHYPSFGKGMKISKILVLGLGGRRELSKEASPRCEELARVHKWTCDRNQSILTWDRFVLSFTCYAYVEANPYPLRTLASKVVHHSSLKTTLCFLDVGRVRGAITPLHWVFGCW